MEVITGTGFDASEHEGSGMSRHRTNVPTSFYHRFAQDVVSFAEEHAEGKIVAVLEGGYSDRALASASLSMMVGLSDGTSGVASPEVASWWDDKALAQMERSCASRVFKPEKPVVVRAGRTIITGPAFPSPSPALQPYTIDQNAWSLRTHGIFGQLEGLQVSIKSETVKKVVSQRGTARTMQLRERRSRGEEITPTASPVTAHTPRNPLSGTPVISISREEVTIRRDEEAEVISAAKIKFIWTGGGVA